MKLVHIVAAGLKNEIGFGNKLLWHLPEDLKFFKNQTWGLPLVMGRKTFESLGKPLAGRVNIVISQKNELGFDDIYTFPNIAKAINFCSEKKYNKMIIGGRGELYRSTFHLIEEIIFTKIYGEHLADTFYQDINLNVWKLKSELIHKADIKNVFDLSFQKWIRK